MPGFVETSFSGIKINSKKGRGERGDLANTSDRQTLRPLEAGRGLNIKKQGLHRSSCLTRTLPRSLKESSCVGLCGDEMQQMRFAFNSIIRKRNSEELNGWC